MERNEISAILAERIGILRAKAGESQQELADKIGVKRETVKFWESGDRQIKGGDIVKIAKHFNVSADYLLGLSDVDTTDPDLSAACEYTGLSKESIVFFAELRSSCASSWLPSYNTFNDFLPKLGWEFNSSLSAVRDSAARANLDLSNLLADIQACSVTGKDERVLGEQIADFLGRMQHIEDSVEVALYRFSESCRNVPRVYGTDDLLKRINESLIPMAAKCKEYNDGEHQED